MGKLTFGQKLGKEIQTLRKAKNLSQEDLADLSQISRVYMGYIEQGRRSPTLEIIAKIAEALKVSLPQLFTFRE